jgi:hypothetical protein
MFGGTLTLLIGRVAKSIGLAFWLSRVAGPKLVIDVVDQFITSCMLTPEISPLVTHTSRTLAYLSAKTVSLPASR